MEVQKVSAELSSRSFFRCCPRERNSKKELGSAKKKRAPRSGSTERETNMREYCRAIDREPGSRAPKLLSKGESADLGLENSEQVIA